MAGGARGCCSVDAVELGQRDAEPRRRGAVRGQLRLGRTVGRMRRSTRRARLADGEPVVWVGDEMAMEDVDGTMVPLRPGDVGFVIDDAWPIDLTVSFMLHGGFTCHPSDIAPDDPSLPRREVDDTIRLEIFSPELAAAVLDRRRDQVITMLADGVLKEDEVDGSWGLSRDSVLWALEFQQSAPRWRKVLRFLRRNLYV